jgi:hypothetical protein
VDAGLGRQSVPPGRRGTVILGEFAYGRQRIEVERMASLWGPVYYLKRVSGRNPVPVATSGPTGLRVTAYVRMNPERLTAALDSFLDRVGEPAVGTTPAASAPRSTTRKRTRP